MFHFLFLLAIDDKLDVEYNCECDVGYRVMRWCSFCS